jgi:hypothetical protein
MDEEDIPRDYGWCRSRREISCGAAFPSLTSKDNPEGRWRSYDWAELAKRDKLDLDLTWLKDDSIEDGSNLPEPDELADEMILDLQNALELLTEVAHIITKRPD